MDSTLVGNTFFFNWEISFMEWLQARLPEWCVPIISALSMFGEELLLIAILGFIYWSYDKKVGKKIGLSMLAANVWNPMLKNLVLRLRPYFASDRIELLRKIDTEADAMDVAAQGYSFPSGHSANAVATYGSIADSYRKKWLTAIALVLPLLVGFSRVAVGAHFPTDVFAGWGIGIIALIVIPFLQEKLPNAWLLYGILLVTALPGFFYCKSNDYYTAYGMLLGFALAEPFERKFVNFANTRSVIRSILRVLGGGIIYLGLNKLLKMPFPKEFLDSGKLAAHIVRTVRYAVVVFTVIGVYPILFKYTAKIGKKTKKDEAEQKETEAA